MQFSPYVKTFSKDTKSISRESIEKKLLLLRTLTNAIAMLHEQRVVHSDLKPDNILVKETASKVLSAKIIDYFNTTKYKVDNGTNGNFDVYNPGNNTQYGKVKMQAVGGAGGAGGNGGQGGGFQELE